MLISFIVSSQGREDKIFKTLNSIKKQSVDSYELIIINDDPNIDKESIDFLHDVFENNENIILVSNSKAQGNATNWNTGISLAKGDYIAFIKEGDILAPNFVKVIDDIVQKSSQKLDIIQYKQKLTGLDTQETYNQLKEDYIYNLAESNEVYAYVQPKIYGKIFRTKYIKDFRLQFRRSVRFDTLFLYKAFAHARTFYKTSEVIASHKQSVLKYSAFDLVNQWPHILNYYRRIGAYKELKDELNYAYMYELTYLFVKLVGKFDNQQLYKKTLKYVETKSDDKLKSFINDNEAFENSTDEEFKKHVRSLDKFIANELKK